MANVWDKVLSQNFFNTQNIVVNHNANTYVGVQLVVNGEIHNNLIDNIVIDHDDPLNKLTVNLTIATTGELQIFSGGILPAHALSPQESASVSALSITPLDNLVKESNLNTLITPAAVFMSNESQGGQILKKHSYHKIEMNDEYLNSNTAIFRFSDSELTILKKGTLQLSAQIGIRKTSGWNRAIVMGCIQVQRNESSYESVWGSKGMCYIRDSNSGNYGSINCSSTLEVMPGDKIQIVAWVHSGSGTHVTEEDATSLSCAWYTQ